jgi:hypothetical protein
VLLTCSAPGVAGPRSSPVVAGKDEKDEVVPRGCSLEHGRRQRGGATEVKSGGDLSSAWERGRARENSKERGDDAACSEVGCPPFIGALEHRGGGGRAVTVGIMTLDSIDGGAGLRPEIQGGRR